MKNYKFIGSVGGQKDSHKTTRCDCEAMSCHPHANCQDKARYIVEIFGLKTRLCLECHANATAWLARYNEGMI